MEPIQDLAELFSLWLTTPTIFLGFYVVVLWFSGAADAARKRNRNATDWFVLGVAVGFLGACVDNGYWGLAWASSYLELECEAPLSSVGRVGERFRLSCGEALASACWSFCY